MENINRERASLIGNDNDEMNDFAIDIMMDSGFEPAPECCIYKVPKRLRQAMDEAYTPQLISIGPFYHGEVSLGKMERQKSVYYQTFCGRTANSDMILKDFLSFIKGNAEHIYKCYDDLVFETESQASKFVRMILYDAVFIIEFFLRHFEKETNDFLLKREWFRFDLKRDLILLENQLPFFVLQNLYSLAIGYFNYQPCRPSSFLELACFFLEINEDLVVRDGIKHLTDLVWRDLARYHPRKSEEVISKVYRATMLHKAGFKFKAGRSNLLDVQFKRGELKIPKFVVDFRSDAAIRNVMAFEQCHSPAEAYVCSYIQLLDNLVDTNEDVDLLVKKRVLDNGMGSSQMAADMINTMMVGIARAELPTCYAQIGNDLNRFYDNSWNHTKANLRLVYFSNIWKGTATVAAFTVVLLTLTQTVLAILDRAMPTK